MAGRRVLSISELTARVKNNLEGSFPDVWVEGEISNFKSHSSGHYYFSLKDETAQLQCAMFRFANRRLRFRPGDGIRVFAHGKLSVYAKRGDYQLIVDTIEPRGKGALQLAFEQLREKLEKEGLFRPDIKKPLPMLPEKIGIVTSPPGAAIRDILNVIGRRFSSLNLIINPVRVQGEGAADEIASAVREFDEIIPVDVIIVTRGGGSIEDLWAFNEEKVARSIFSCETPVISAVGHEIDLTIADLAADIRAPTPSAAAEIVTAEKEKLGDKIRQDRMKIIRCVEQKVSFAVERVNYFQTGYGFRRVEDKINEYAQQLDERQSALASTVLNTLRLKEKNLDSLKGRLFALSPKSILKRGYSITLKLPEKKVLTGIEAVKKGEKVRILLSRGAMEAEITLTEDNNEI